MRPTPGERDSAGTVRAAIANATIQPITDEPRKLDEHLCGLFRRATWVGLIEGAGFDVRAVGLTHDERPVGAEGFLGIRGG